MGKEHDLLEAAKAGNVTQIEKLLQIKRTGIASFRFKCVNPNCQDETGNTPLHHAALNGHKEAVHVLLDYNASNHIPDNTGSYPLHLAAWKGDLDIARLLIHRGPSKASVNEQNSNGETALHSAAQYGHTGVVSLLLESGADPTLRNTTDESPLDLGAKYDKLECVKLLLGYQPNLVLQNSKRHTPIHLAARNGHKTMVALLLKHGMDVNVKAHSGSCLHEASLYGKVEVVRLLLDAGIDVSITDSSGGTAVDILEGHNAKKAIEIRTLLKEHSMHQGWERHQRQSAVFSYQSDVLVDFGDNSSENGGHDVPRNREVDQYGPGSDQSQSIPSDEIGPDYALLGEPVPTASTTAPAPPFRTSNSWNRPQSVPPSLPPLHDQRSLSQSPTHVDSDILFLSDDSPSQKEQSFPVLERSLTMDTYTRNRVSSSDEPPALPLKRRHTNRTSERRISSGQKEIVGKAAPETASRLKEESSLPHTTPLTISTNPFSPFGSIDMDHNPRASDPFVQLDVSALKKTTNIPTSDKKAVDKHNRFAGLHLGGSIEALGVPADVYIAEAMCGEDGVETEDEWAQVERLLVSVDEVGNSLAETPLKEQSTKSLNESIEDLTSMLSGHPSTLQSIDEFLERYTGLQQYADLMVANGFDQVNFLANGVLRESDLKDIGISHQDDRQKIMWAVESLPTAYCLPLPTSADSIGEWLSELKLAHYTALFIKHGFTSLDSVKELCGLELDKVLPIRCLGHARRLSAGIAALTGIQQLLSPQLTSTVSTVNEEECEQYLDEAESWPNNLTADVLRDYSQITSKASPQQPAEVPSEEDHQFGAPNPDAVLGEERPDRQSSDIPTIRPPQVAQKESRRLIGHMNEDTHLTASDKWRHPVSVILMSNVNYVAKYLGSMLVANVQGTESTRAACAKMRESTRHMKKMPLIVLAISAKGVKFIDGDSKMLVQEHDIRTISYCAQDREDLRTFAYINKDNVTGKHYCHVFQAQTMNVADDIILTIGQAFEVAYQKIMQLKAKQDADKFEADLGSRQSGQGSPSASSHSSQTVREELSTMALGPAKTS